MTLIDRKTPPVLECVLKNGRKRIKWSMMVTGIEDTTEAREPIAIDSIGRTSRRACCYVLRKIEGVVVMKPYKSSKKAKKLKKVDAVKKSKQDDWSMADEDWGFDYE